MVVVTEKIDGNVYHRVTGECSFRGVIDYVKHNSSEWITINSLWDFTGSTFAHDIPNYNLLKVRLIEIKEIVENRVGKKSAFVVYDDATFATIRMAITAVEVIENRFKMCVFRNIAEAIKWLEN